MEPEAKEQHNENLAESNLLTSSTIEIPTTTQIKAPTSIDDLPIGGGSKFKWSQFPQDGAPPPKPPTRKPPAKKKKEEAAKEPEPATSSSNVPVENQDERPLNVGSSSNAFDEMPIGKSSKMSIPEFIDERPIGKSAFNVSEFPEDQEPANQKASNLPLDQRLKSKAIKTKLAAFQELLSVVAQGSINQPPLSLVEFDKLLKETNPGGLEKIVTSFQIWCQKNGNWGEQQIKQLIENPFGNGKGQAKKIASELLDFMYEKKPQAVETVIVAGLKGKVIKTVTAYISALNELLPIYGIKKLGLLKPYYPDVIRLISNEKLPAIKTQGMNLLRTAMMWLTKDFLEPYFKSNNLKEALKNQLDAFWQTYDKTTVMSAPKMDPQTKKGGGGGKIDIYQESQQVDIFKKFNEKWSEGVLKVEKWNEKTEMMQQLVNAANVPRLANTQFRHIIDMIKRLINDSNMNVVMMDLKVLGALAKGLRKHFAPYAKMFFGNVSQKFKDKKTLMIEQTNKCLDEFYYCLSVEDVLQDLKEGMSDKNPNIKIHLMNWIDRSIERKVRDRAFQEKGKDALKSLFPIFEKLCNDGAVQVRENTAKAICNMKSSLGDDFFTAFETKLGKTLVSKGGPAKPPAKETAQPPPALSASTVIPKPANPPPSTTNALSKTTNFSKQKAPKVEQKSEDYEMPSYEQCYQTLVGQGVSQDQLKVVVSGNAKQKAALLQTLKNEEFNFEAVLKVLRKMYKDWKESNLVMNKQLMAYLAANVQRINKREFYVILPCLIEKLGDTKFADPVATLTEALTCRIPPKFFVNQILRYMKPSETRKPSPKQNGQVCNYLCQLIDKVSLGYVPFKDVVEFGKQCFQTPLSKKGATALFKKLYEYMGESLKMCLDQTLIKSLDPEFKKTTALTQPEKRPKITFRGQAQDEVKHEKVVNPLQTLPRADISNEIARFLPKITDGNWQVRKEGVQSLDTLLSQNGHRIQMIGLTDLISALKGRINDSNKSLCKLFISFTAHLIQSVGKDIRVHSKVLILALIEVLADKTEAIRKQGVQSLNRIGNVVGYDVVVNCMGQPLESDKVQFRSEILNFLLTNEDHLGKLEGKEFAKGIVNCLCDKNKDIRNASERLLEKIHERIGMDYLRMTAKDYRPAFIKDLTAIFDKIDKNSGNAHTQSNLGSTIRNSSPSAKAETNTAKKPPISGSKNAVNQASTNNLASTLPPSSSLSNSSVMSRTMPQKNLSDSGVGLSAVGSAPAGNAFTGDQPLAGTKFLAVYRQQRTEQDQNIPWTYDNIKQMKEDELTEDIAKSFRRDIANRMLSLDYRKLAQAGIIISKMCKDLSLHASLRELNDVVLRWIFLRLWGGNQPAILLMEIVPQMLSILEKKGVGINEHDVSLVIAIIRQYCMATASHEVRVNENLHTITKCLIKLHSGDRVLKMFLKQYTLDLLVMHRHGRRESNPYYRQTLNRIIKNNLMDFVGNQELLTEISKIKELNRDGEFLDMLFQRFNETALHGYGFRRENAVKTDNQHSSSVEKLQSHPSTTNLNNSQIRANPNIPPFPTKPQTANLPPQPPTLTSASLQSSTLKKVDSQSNIQTSGVNMMPPPVVVHPPQTPTYTQPVQPQQVADPPLVSRLNLSSYPCPHPSSPLSEHLSRLNPPNDETLTFFQTLFVQASDKITSQLQNYAKIILAAILKANITMLDRRNDYPPEKIINQLNLLQQTLKNKHVIRNVGEVLSVATEFVLKQLVYEDQNKAAINEALRERGIDFKTDNFVKIINGVMLRILQNSHPHAIIIILFDLLIKTLKKPVASQKTICLIAKCIGRVSNSYMQQLQESNLIELILKFHQYCTQLQGRLKPQDQGLKLIENMLTEISKQMKENIWNSYEKAMNQSTIPDDFIIKHLQALKIPYPDRNRPSQKEEELKKITEFLSKYRTYETGISMLNSFMDQNPQFQIAQYFSNLNYDSRFINKVLNSLESNFRRPPPRNLAPQVQRQPQQRSVERSEAEEPSNVQSQIRSLRQRFDQMHRNEPVAPQPAPPANNEPDADRASEIRRRITQMKAKINNSIK